MWKEVQVRREEGDTCGTGVQSDGSLMNRKWQIRTASGSRAEDKFPPRLFIG